MTKICHHCTRRLALDQFETEQQTRPAGICRDCQRVPPNLEDAIDLLTAQHYGPRSCAGCGR